jgi:DNA-binding response OmpR family regulator
MALEDNEFKTDTYTDPALAYDNFSEGLYDLVILDIKMPEVNGFQLYQKTDGKVKIIFLTASQYYH